MSIYVDTSFVVSIYLTDAHSIEADRLLKMGQGSFCTPLHLVEFAHSIEQNVFRRKISAADAKQLFREFEEDRRTGIWRDVAQPELTFAFAADLARSHTAVLGTRTLDTLHVAAALELKAERFWTFDDRQEKLARTVGLKLK